MSISEDTVRYVARLAQLELQDSEVADLAVDLAKVLTFVERLEADAVPVPADPARSASLREDRVEPWPDLDATAPAPEARDGLFRVPPVMGG